MDWVERLGGWAVVVMIVRWMLASQKDLIKTLTRAVDAFQEFEKAEEIHHVDQTTAMAKIVETQKEILAELRELRATRRVG